MDNNFLRESEMMNGEMIGGKKQEVRSLNDMSWIAKTGEIDDKYLLKCEGCTFLRNS